MKMKEIGPKRVRPSAPLDPPMRFCKRNIMASLASRGLPTLVASTNIFLSRRKYNQSLKDRLAGMILLKKLGI